MEATIITIFNRLKKQDSLDGVEKWFKTELTSIPYKMEKEIIANGVDFSMHQTFVILLPFNEKYVPYQNWKSLTDKTNVYTVNQGDFIIIGESITDELTPEYMDKVKSKYSPMACEVRVIEEVKMTQGLNIQFRIRGV